VNKVWNAKSSRQKEDEQKRDEVLVPIQSNNSFPFPEADEKPNNAKDDQWNKGD